MNTYIICAIVLWGIYSIWNIMATPDRQKARAREIKKLFAGAHPSIAVFIYNSEIFKDLFRNVGESLEEMGLDPVREGEDGFLDLCKWDIDLILRTKKVNLEESVLIEVNYVASSWWPFGSDTQNIVRTHTVSDPSDERELWAILEIVHTLLIKACHAVMRESSALNPTKA